MSKNSGALRDSRDAGLSNHMAKGMLKLFILFSVAKAPNHGYSLLKEFRLKSKSCPAESKKDVGVGEFYSMIDVLESSGLVKSIWEGKGRPRKILSITPKGKEVVHRAKKHFSAALGMFKEIVPELFERKGGRA